jgi:hypothetical protein
MGNRFVLIPYSIIVETFKIAGFHSTPFFIHFISLSNEGVLTLVCVDSDTN